jgi:hypothetical protein
MTVEFCIETRNRIRLAVAAYAYECMNDSIMSDAEFDELSKKIDPSFKTGNRKLDNFFKKKFSADTGMWVHMHPERHKLDYLYRSYYK